MLKVFGKIIVYLLMVLLVNVHVGYTDTICPAGKTCIDNPIGPSNPNVNVMIGKVINSVLGVVGSIALAVFIYGGFIMMTAAGNNERIQKGKDILIWATVGLVVIFTAYAAAKLVIEGAALS